MTPYVTVVEAQLYFDTVINTDAWDLTTPEQRLKALCHATRIINALPFKSHKVDMNQENAFPREHYDTPVNVKNACCEIALALLNGVDPEKNALSLRVSSEAFGSVRSAYDTTIPMPHFEAGVPSVTAWQYLLPFIHAADEIRIVRA